MGKRKRKKSSTSDSRSRSSSHSRSSSRSRSRSRSRSIQPVWATQAQAGQKVDLNIPDHLGTDVTFDQKKRLARLAKMGLGPVAKAGGTVNAETTQRNELEKPDSDEDVAARGRERQLRDQERRAALLEHERRIRMHEARREEEEERKAKEADRRAKRPGGMMSLGPVQPRDDKHVAQRDAAQSNGSKIVSNAKGLAAAGFLVPTTAMPRLAGASFVQCATPSAASGVGKLAIKISTDTVQRVGTASTATAECENDEHNDENENDHSIQKELSSLLPEAQVLASLRHDRSERKSKKQKKMLRKARHRSSSSGDAAGSSDEADRGAADEAVALQARSTSRDGGISWKAMSVDSVRGKVSNDNKRLTDADLERRFAAQASPSAAGGLMTETQVLAMLKKERGARDANSSARRAQRELAEWTSRKAERLLRNGHDDKERLVVARK